MLEYPLEEARALLAEQKDKCAALIEDARTKARATIVRGVLVFIGNHKDAAGQHRSLKPCPGCDCRRSGSRTRSRPPR